jgi:hypothetical protein
MSAREHTIKVSLSDAELAILDEHRGSTPRAAYLRRLIQGPGQDVATRSEALGLLTELARDRRTQAVIALARELREGGDQDVMSWVIGVPDGG